MEKIKRPVGRPREQEDTARVNIYISAKTRKAAKIIGDGNLSAGLRIAIEHYIGVQKCQKALENS